MRILLILFMVFAFIPKLKAQSSDKENFTTNTGKVKALVVIYDITHKKKPKKEAYNKAITLISGSKVIETSFRCDSLIFINMSEDRNENINMIFPNIKLIETLNRSVKKGHEIHWITTRTHNTKQILGLNCDEYKIQIPNYDNSNFKGGYAPYYVYAYGGLNDYKNNYTWYKGVSGVLLKDETPEIWNTHYKQAVSISEQYVDSSLFNIPLDYSILTVEEVFIISLIDANFFGKGENPLVVTDKETIKKWNDLYDLLSKTALKNPLKIE